MPGKKHIPERQCLGCGTKKPKAELLRIVRSPDGAVSLDPTGKAPGRGAYLCGDPACVARLRKTRRVGAVLGTPVPDSVWEQIAGGGPS
jgi:predicted RNA-binding protein YlxR (DUF448 family)